MTTSLLRLSPTVSYLTRCMQLAAGLTLANVAQAEEFTILTIDVEALHKDYLTKDKRAAKAQTDFEKTQNEHETVIQKFNSTMGVYQKVVEQLKTLASTDKKKPPSNNYRTASFRP